MMNRKLFLGIAFALLQTTNVSANTSIGGGDYGGAIASGSAITAIGENAEASGEFSTAIGQDAKVTGNLATAVGQNAIADGLASTALGQNTSASGDFASALGQNAHVTGGWSTAVGEGSLVSGDYSSAMGQYSRTEGNWSTAAGQGSYVNGDFSSAIGQNSKVEGNNSTALGQNSSVTAERGTALGQNSSVTAVGAVAIGQDSVADRENTVSVGSEGQERQIVNVADGEVSSTSKDAINGSQLNELAQQINNIDGGINIRMNNLDSKINKVGAGAAAMASLHPLEYDADDKLSFATGIGSYHGSSAVALGAFYRPDGNTLVNFSASMGNGENIYGLGMSFALDGKKSSRNVSKKALVQNISTLTIENERLGSKLDSLENSNSKMAAEIEQLKVLVSSLK